MYKILFFLKKEHDDSVLDHFKNVTLKLLSDIAGTEIKLGKIESNLLSEVKYSHYCEIIARSKEEMDRLMNTKAGKELNKDLMEFHNFITTYSIDYSN
jgi:hypothetical protein